MKHEADAVKHEADVAKHRKARDDRGGSNRWEGFPQLVFRSRDQVAIACLLCGCLVLLVGQWFYFGGASGRLIEIDDAEPRTIEFRIDINEADWREFHALPSIGEKMAKRIVEYRDEHGPFEDHGDLLRVKGIAARTLLKIRPYLIPVSDIDRVEGDE